MNLLIKAGHIPRVFCVCDKQSNFEDLPFRKEYVLCAHDGIRSLPIYAALKPKPSLTNDASAKAQTHKKTRKIAKLKRLLGAWHWPQVCYQVLAAPVNDFAPDIIHANDLSTLSAGVRLAQELECNILYDAHEYEQDRNQQLSNLEKRLRKATEQRLIKKVDCVLTVSEVISSKLEIDYNIPRPRVVLNTPDSEKSQKNKPNHSSKKLRGVSFGSIQTGRGFEQIIAALPKSTETHITFLGDGAPPYITYLNSLASSLDVLEQITFCAAVPSDALKERLQAFDFSVIAIQPTCLSYLYCLPNKLFEAVDAGLPIVTTPLPEVKKFIERYKCGIIAGGFESPDLASAFTRIHQFSQTHGPSVSLPKSFSWNFHESRLMQIYQDLYHRRPVSEFEILPHITADEIKAIIDQKSV